MCARETAVASDSPSIHVSAGAVTRQAQAYAGARPVPDGRAAIAPAKAQRNRHLRPRSVAARAWPRPVDRGTSEMSEAHGECATDSSVHLQAGTSVRTVTPDLETRKLEPGAVPDQVRTGIHAVPFAGPHGTGFGRGTQPVCHPNEYVVKLAP